MFMEISLEKEELQRDANFAVTQCLFPKIVGVLRHANTGDEGRDSDGGPSDAKG